MNKRFKLLEIFLLIISICFAIPSVIYLWQNKTVLNFNGNLEFRFLLTEDIDRLLQAIVYVIILFAFIAFYYLIIKNRNKLFNDIE